MILINGSPNVGDDLTAVSGQITTVDGIVDAIKLSTDNLPTDPADQSLVDAKLGVVTDTAATQTLLGYENSFYQHIHNPAKVYPTLNAGVAVAGGAGAWELGNKVEVVPVNTITHSFDIHYINVENASTTDVYELVLWKGGAGAEIEIGRVRTHKNSTQSGAINVPIQIAPQLANTRISATVASSGGGDTLTISVFYHEYV